MLVTIIIPRDALLRVILLKNHLSFVHLSDDVIAYSVLAIEKPLSVAKINMGDPQMQEQARLFILENAYEI